MNCVPSNTPIVVPARFQIIYADPPWSEKGGGHKYKRGADRHYSVMTTDEIAALPIASIAADDAHLYLWATNNHLPDALRVMSAWGFRYVTTITWVKDRFGLGQYFRGMTEHCLFGVRGMLPYLVKSGKRAQGRTVIVAPKTEHSAKPVEMRLMIEHVSGAPNRAMIELFARERAPGWFTWGNEIESDIEFP